MTLPVLTIPDRPESIPLAVGKSPDPAQPPTQPAPTPRPIRYSQIIPENLQWLWPDRIPLGKLTLIVGETGAGTGLLAIDVAARLTSGRAWPGDSRKKTPPASVILLHGNDDQSSVVAHRLVAAGADLDRIITFQNAADFD